MPFAPTASKWKQPIDFLRCSCAPWGRTRNDSEMLSPRAAHYVTSLRRIAVAASLTWDLFARAKVARNKVGREVG